MEKGLEDVLTSDHKGCGRRKDQEPLSNSLTHMVTLLPSPLIFWNQPFCYPALKIKTTTTTTCGLNSGKAFFLRPSFPSCHPRMCFGEISTSPGLTQPRACLKSLTWTLLRSLALLQSRITRQGIRPRTGRPPDATPPQAAPSGRASGPFTLNHGKEDSEKGKIRRASGGQEGRAPVSMARVLVSVSILSTSMNLSNKRNRVQMAKAGGCPWPHI